jgi:hypothetical protein
MNGGEKVGSRVWPAVFTVFAVFDQTKDLFSPLAFSLSLHCSRAFLLCLSVYVCVTACPKGEPWLPFQ